MGKLEAPASSTFGSSDAGPEPTTTGVTDFSTPAAVGPAATEDASISPTCEPPTVRAWSDETEPIDRDRLPWRKTWVMAAILVLAPIAVGAVVWLGYLAWPRASQSDSPSAAPPSPTPTTNAAPPPLPVPTSAQAPPATVTVPGPPSTLQASPTPNAGIPMEVVAAYDRQFLNNMVAKGWIITNPEAMVKNAHRTCALFQRGVAQEEVNRQLVIGTGMTMYEAAQFSSTAMVTYPDCP
jgi:hypothetical protein